MADSNVKIMANSNLVTVLEHATYTKLHIKQECDPTKILVTEDYHK